MSRRLGIWRIAAAMAASVAAAGCAPALVAVGAGAAVGIAAQDRSLEDQATDLEIEVSIQNALANQSGELFRDVFVESVEGRVLLTGSVDERRQIIDATRIAWSTAGVREVVDELTVGADAGTEAYARDVWISTQVRAKLVGAFGADAANYNIETVDGVTHLLGLAPTRAELTRAADLAASVPGVVRVVSHVLLLDDPRRHRAGAPPATV